MLNRGFTLVEMLITLTVLALLTAVGVPSYRHIIQTVQQKTAQATLASLNTALALGQFTYGGAPFKGSNDLDHHSRVLNYLVEDQGLDPRDLTSVGSAEDFCFISYKGQEFPGGASHVPIALGLNAIDGSGTKPGVLRAYFESIHHGTSPPSPTEPIIPLAPETLEVITDLIFRRQ